MRGLLKRWFTLVLLIQLAALCSQKASVAQSLGNLLRHHKLITNRGNKPTRDGGSESLPQYFGPKQRIAVMGLDSKISTSTASDPVQQGGVVSNTTVQIPPPADLGTGLTEMLITSLENTHRFILLERTALQDIQAEQQLGTSGALNPATIPKAGSLLGAQALVRGAITEYSFAESSLGGGGILGNLGIAHSSMRAMIALDVRLYDTTTGEILNSVHAVGHASSSGTSVNYTNSNLAVGSTAFSQSPLGEACRRALAKAVLFICKSMVAIPWEGRIADVEPDGASVTLYLNAGKDDGIKAGDTLDILKPGHTIVDPATQTVIGHVKDVPEGTAHVVEVKPKLSILAVDSGSGFSVGDVVRMLPATVQVH